MEKMQTGRRSITTLPVHGHQNRLIYALTMLLIAKIIIFRLLGIRQGGYIDDGTEIVSRNIKYPIAFSKAILSINFTMICPVGGQSYGYAARITSISGLTSFAAYSNYPKAFWLAIGI